jgi:hypothetical protein
VQVPGDEDPLWVVSRHLRPRPICCKADTNCKQDRATNFSAAFGFDSKVHWHAALAPMAIAGLARLHAPFFAQGNYFLVTGEVTCSCLHQRSVDLSDLPLIAIKVRPYVLRRPGRLAARFRLSVPL